LSCSCLSGGLITVRTVAVGVYSYLDKARANPGLNLPEADAALRVGKHHEIAYVSGT